MGYESWEQGSGELAFINAGRVSDSCLPAGQKSRTRMLACVLWSRECGNALGQWSVTPAGRVRV